MKPPDDVPPPKTRSPPGPPSPPRTPGRSAGGAAPASFQVAVMPGGWMFDAGPDEPLLDAARRAGVALPKSCRNGTCRTCLCRMLSGAVHYHIEWPGLSREEKAEGYILPCVAHADTDVVIEAPAARKARGA